MKKNVRKKKKKKNVEIVVRKEIRKLVFKVTKLISSLINKTLIGKINLYSRFRLYYLTPCWMPIRTYPMLKLMQSFK